MTSLGDDLFYRTQVSLGSGLWDCNCTDSDDDGEDVDAMLGVVAA